MFLYADSEDSDQTGRMPRLICVFAGRKVILLVLPCGGSILFNWIHGFHSFSSKICLFSFNMEIFSFSLFPFYIRCQTARHFKSYSHKPPKNSYHWWFQSFSVVWHVTASMKWVYSELSLLLAGEALRDLDASLPFTCSCLSSADLETI